MNRIKALAIGTALMISLAGCISNNTESLGEPAQGPDEVISVENNTDDTKKPETENKADETNQDDKKDDNSDDATVETPASKDKEASEAVDLYNVFQINDQKALYRGMGDTTSYLETSVALKVGEYYTMDEIVLALSDYGEGMGFASQNPANYELIDCGNDGIPELLATIDFEPEFTLYMIIKEIDGELVICYTGDGWSRNSITIHQDGTILSVGSGGANVVVASAECVNADGTYNYFYGVTETGSPTNEYYANTSKGEYKVINLDGIDLNNIFISGYYFTSDYNESEYYYTLFEMDDNRNDITSESTFKKCEELIKRFEKEGIKINTNEEIQEMLDERAAKINYIGPY
ncbi:MAG: hypothetical protein K5776_12530 [Lachnospiraceae bacterium]|nr:hypothetical protein [Lachnospiraceae bacterium]